jgi:hypothetical protein
MKNLAHLKGEFIKGRIYLSLIMERSRDIGVIDDTTYSLWEGVIQLRNALVHNNGISEKTAMYVYPETNIQLSTGEMSQGNLKMFGHLTKWILSESKFWLIKVHNYTLQH